MFQRLINGARAAFAMFSRIPVGVVDWENGSLSLMLCFFPLVGAVIGLGDILLSHLGAALGFGDTWMGISLMLCSVLITGGIHLDGFMDVGDALSCWQGKEKRLEILKDSHVGAFAVIRLFVLLSLQVAAFSEFWKEGRAMAIMALCFVLSRALSGLGVILLPKAKKEGSLSSFSQESQKKIVVPVLGGIVAACALAMGLLSLPLGGGAAVAAFLSFAWYRHVALKFFGGTTGDVGGYFVCVCETACLLVLAVLCRLL